MNPASVFSWIVSGIGIVGFLAAAAAYVRGSADKGTIASLKSSVDALEIENDIKDRRIATLERDDELKTQQISALEQEVSVLHSALGGKEELTRMQQTLETHHELAMAEDAAIREELRGLRVLLQR